ncbi:MAG: NAD(P)H-dependent glycerol-3-phosphate dehydrogenase [Tepidanaerobacteraceae bacterium]|jgi:glycerol-3-phosphate dehydrogenase (NAD(P)+)|nr:NAD(P)H-dependent glycerol-3-phosphate dehydrogenase [Tepidanaerobacteraceae bacterium]
MKVAVVGAGGWGTTLANMLAQNGIAVSLWSRRPELAEEIKICRENKAYLPGIKISNNIFISSDIERVVHDSEFVVMAVPSHSMGEIARRIARHLKDDAIIISAAKGLETDSFRRMSEVLEQELPSKFSKNIAVLSGPSHAEEVSKELPTAVVAASAVRQVAELVQDIFMNNYFRVYTNPDVVGVEIGGALKNVIAICSGISDGLGFGDNTRSALMTRGIVEITRLGIRLGAMPATFGGLSGIGDLIVTCSSLYSRNRRAGIEIGRGKTVKQVAESTKMVIEGINTTKAAFLLAKKLNIEMPITEQAYAVLFQNKNPLDAVTTLMNRRGKHEIEDIIFIEKPSQC